MTFANEAPPSILFHGSTELLTVIEPRNEYGFETDSDVIFATPYFLMAVAYMGRWNDALINQGGDEKCPWVLEEMRYGAFEEIFGQKPGYLYSLPRKYFSPASRTSGLSPDGEPWEFISATSVAPLAVMEFPHVLDFLTNLEGLTMKKYREDDESYWRIIRSRVTRASNLAPANREKYIEWIKSINPTMADDMESL